MTDTVQPVNLRARSEFPLHVHQYKIVAGQECAPLEVNPASKVSVQVDGVFDGGTVELRGSLDGVTFHDLLDAHGYVVTLKAPGIKTLGEAVRFVQPDPLLGDKGDVVVTILTGGAA